MDVSGLCEQFLEEVLVANRTVNLTSITDKEEGQLLHIEDSLAALPELIQAPEGEYADLGSGAGFPGVPLALASGRPVLLVEAVKKKCAAIEDIVERLGLQAQVSFYPGRAEELARCRPAAFSAITARALSRLPSLMELASPLLQQAGMLICLKSADITEELDQARGVQEKLALSLVDVRTYTLSDEVTRRSVVVFEKRGEPCVSLPRRAGMAQKRPYKG